MKRAISEAAKDQRRDLILDAALEEFFESGFRAARMDDIARRAGISKGTVYLYFNSKEEVFTALVTSIALPKIEHIEQTLKRSGNVKAALHALFQYIPTVIRESKMPKMVKILISDARAFPEVVRDYRENVLKRVLAALTALLKRGCRSGEIHTPAPEHTARLLIAPVIFSAIWIVIFEEDRRSVLDMEGLFAAHEAMVLKALAVPAGRRK